MLSTSEGGETFLMYDASRKGPSLGGLSSSWVNAKDNST